MELTSQHFNLACLWNSLPSSFASLVLEMFSSFATYLSNFTSGLSIPLCWEGQLPAIRLQFCRLVDETPESRDQQQAFQLVITVLTYRSHCLHLALLHSLPYKGPIRCCDMDRCCGHLQYHGKQIIGTTIRERCSLGQEAPCLPALLIKYPIPILKEAAFVSDESGIVFKILCGAV